MHALCDSFSLRACCWRWQEVRWDCSWLSGHPDLLRVCGPVNGGELAIDASPNLRVLLFTLVVSMLTVLLFGIVPALRASKLDLVPILKDSTATLRSFAAALRCTVYWLSRRVTLSLVLLAGAGLFLRSLWKLQSIEKGFTGDNVLAMSLNMELQGYDKARGANFYPAALESLTSLPGVQSVSLASALPVTAGGSRMQMDANSTKPAVNEEISIDIVTVVTALFRDHRVATAARSRLPADRYRKVSESNDRQRDDGEEVLAGHRSFGKDFHRRRRHL